MSLILEALRKLEKEKATADRGFVVLGAASWPAPAARRWPVPAALVAGIVGAAALGWWALAPGRGPAEVAALPSPAAAAPPVSAAAEPPPAPVPRAPRRAAREKPVRALAAAPAASATPERRLQLQAISVRDGKPVALVGDRLLGEGEAFEGVKVLAIRAEEVEVEVDGRRRTLRF